MSGEVSKRWDQRIFLILWTWLAVRTALPWLVTFRITLEGSGYSWGAEYFGRMFYSSGFARIDFLLIYVFLAASLLVIHALRKHRLSMAAPLLVAYLGFYAANAFFFMLKGEPMMFHGDTLGIHLDLTPWYLGFQFGMFALALAWWWGVKAMEDGPGASNLAGWRKRVVQLCMAVVPVQLPLLIFGEPHGTTDAIGVIMTLSQWFLLAIALYPGASYGAEKPAVPGDGVITAIR